MDNNRFQNAIKYIDEANALDPNREEVNGTKYPAELLYSRRMTETLNKMVPNASDILQLACRCQHIRRWDIPRKNYPMDRKGYLQWRVELGNYHAQVVSEILRKIGYSDDIINQIETILQKKKLKRDPDTQIVEDVSCNVFLQYYFADFSKKHEEDKVINIIRKTWKKMSKLGHQHAMKIDFNAQQKMIIDKALKD